MKKLFTVCAALVATMSMSAENMTCADAAAAALALGENVESTETVSVEGYITKTNGTVSREQQTFYMDDVKGSGALTLQAYWANLPADDKETPLAVGDKVILTGKLLHYVSDAGVHTAEIKNGDVTVLDRTIVKLDTIQVDACAAIEEGLALNNKEYTEDIFEVSGVVSAVSNTNDTHHSQTFDLECATQTALFEAYNCTVIGDYVAVGDSVVVLGKLTNYDGTIEIASGKAWVTKKGNVKIDTISVTVAEALAAAQKLENNAASKDVYAVTGYVDSISYAYSEQHDNISFFMCDDLANPVYEFQAYRAKGGKELTVGTKVIVTGNLYHYYKAATEDAEEQNKYQMNAGATIEIISAEGVENITIENAATKLIENGQLVIIRNGVRYNAAGVVME